MNDPAREVRIRPMTIADLEQVLEIAGNSTDAPGWPRSAYLQALDPHSTPRRIALVATGPKQKEIRGFLIAVLTPPDAELESIAVAPALKRCGIGRHLLQGFVGELTHEAIQKLYLEVRSSNAAALSLYRAAGFIRCGVRPDYYADPVEDAVLMELRLGHGCQSKTRVGVPFSS